MNIYDIYDKFYDRNKKKSWRLIIIELISTSASSFVFKMSKMLIKRKESVYSVARKSLFCFFMIISFVEKHCIHGGCNFPAYVTAVAKCIV